MNRFAPALRRTARELDLPPRVRAEVLLELAADLEAAYEAERARGSAEEEAIRRAEERVLGSPEMVRRLARLHSDRGGGWLHGIGGPLSQGVGLVLLLVAVVPLLAISAGVAVAGLLAAPSSPLVWAILLVGGAIALLMGRASLRLASGGMPSQHRLASLLALSMVAPALGLLAALLGLHSVAMELSAGGTPAPMGMDPFEPMARDGSALVAGLLLGLTGALSWFVLRERASARAAREAEALLEGTLPFAPEQWERRERIIPLARRRRP